MPLAAAKRRSYARISAGNLRLVSVWVLNGWVVSRFQFKFVKHAHLPSSSVRTGASIGGSLTSKATNNFT